MHYHQALRIDRVSLRSGRLGDDWQFPELLEDEISARIAPSPRRGDVGRGRQLAPAGGSGFIGETHNRDGERSVPWATGPRSTETGVPALGADRVGSG